MYALTFHGKETVKYEPVPDPKIKAPTDVIVKVHLTAICGSDLHPYHEREKGLDHGTVMGHEFVGEIIEVGREVGRFKKGDLVFSPFTSNCGQCFYCRKGLTCRCQSGELFGWVQNGIGLEGAQAEFVRVPLADSTLLTVPENVLPEEALLLDDVFSAGYYCADMAEAVPDGVYVILGCGPVGLMAILGARDLGAEKIYAVDAIPERLTLAQNYGATPINCIVDTPIDIINEVTEGRGADAVMEVVGNISAAKMAFDLVGAGGIISVVGFHIEEQFAFTPLEAYDKNITYKIGRCPARDYMERLIPLVQEKKYDITAIISHRMPLNQGLRAYEIFDKKLDGCVKVVLKT